MLDIILTRKLTTNETENNNVSDYSVHSDFGIVFDFNNDKKYII
jgi:hypothetical protein